MVGSIFFGASGSCKAPVAEGYDPGPNLGLRSLEPLSSIFIYGTGDASFFGMLN